MRRAVFLDRDGVLIRDNGRPISRIEEIQIIAGAVTAVATLHDAGFKLIVVSNQTVIARGLAKETDVDRINQCINDTLGRSIDRFYICPHHPEATIERYRQDCVCRKPRPGMLLRAAIDLDIDLSKSILIGDRLSDIAAGQAAGCHKTILVGRNNTPAIVSAHWPAKEPKPDFICAALTQATGVILST